MKTLEELGQEMDDAEAAYVAAEKAYYKKMAELGDEDT